ncbi:MAG: PA2169 family four-helix-bundle protein [Robiginitalea sp.]|jgi:uncharacterized protein (TIGR02284 family)
MKYSEKISNRLNDLLAKTYDAEKGYKMAAEKIDMPSVKKFLSDKVRQRATFAHELKSEIMEYGQLPDEGGTVSGDIHRGWINLKAALSSNKTEQILEEVERGEKASLESYDEILKDRETVLPPSTEQLLTKQRQAIQASLNTSKMYEEIVS